MGLLDEVRGDLPIHIATAKRETQSDPYDTDADSETETVSWTCGRHELTGSEVYQMGKPTGTRVRKLFGDLIADEKPFDEKWNLSCRGEDLDITSVQEIPDDGRVIGVVVTCEVRS